MELGAEKVDEIFVEFEQEATAAASLAQVRARCRGSKNNNDVIDV